MSKDGQGIAQVAQADAPEASVLLPRDDDRLPHMPSPAQEGQDAEEWRRPLRTFHLTGKSPRTDAEPQAKLPLWPALADCLRADAPLLAAYPLYLPDAPDQPDARPMALMELLKSALEEGRKKGADFPILQDKLEALVAGCQQGTQGEEFGRAMGKALDRFAARFEVSDAARSELNAEVQHFKDLLPRSGRLISFGPETPAGLYAWAAQRQRKPAADRLRRQVRQLVNSLEALLEVDRSHRDEAMQRDSVSGSLGEQAGAFLDADSLSRLIPKPRGSRPLQPERRDRIERALETLRDFSQREEDPPCRLIHSGPPPQAFPQESLVCRPDSFSAAIEVFDAMADAMAEVFRAVRTSRLEIEGRYDPEQHDAMLERFEWQSCTAEELLALPPVLVWESARNILSQMASLSRLLRSSRPVHVLIGNSEPSARSEDGDEDLSGYLPDFGYLAVAHREALVLQTSLAQPRHLADGLLEMSLSLRPAMCVAAVPDDSRPGELPWLQSLAAHASRTTPCFRYSPEGGESWADRFSLDANPQPERISPVLEAACMDGDGKPGQRQESPTFAHAAALNPKYRRHFQVIPTEAWDGEQLEVEEYLSSFTDSPPQALPYIWVVDDGGQLQRAVLTREMASACRDRRRSWRILQELGGVNNEYVRRAEARLREELTAQFEADRQEMLEQARRQGAAEAVERLVAVLTNPDALAAVPAARPPQAPPAPAELPPPAETAAAPEPAAAPVEEELLAEDPYIDSDLCTSCNDCMKINQLLFVYNADKQAVIGDAQAGTYAELVKAAEACPARCIHPGTPRPGDETATEEVLARAAAYR